MMGCEKMRAYTNETMHAGEGMQTCPKVYMIKNVCMRSLNGLHRKCVRPWG